MSAKLPPPLVRAALRTTLRPVFAPGAPPALQRAAMNASALALPMPTGVRQGRGALAGVPGRVLLPANHQPHTAVVHLHGGGYVTGSAFAFRALAAQLAQRCASRVFVPDYRRAPEHPYPAALDDAVAFVRGLQATGVRRLVLTGDSAGAGLAIAAAGRLRAIGAAAPELLVLLSPWVDLTFTGESLRTRAPRDPLLRETWLRDCARNYRGFEPAQHPDISPLRADLSQLPPLLIHAGADDILLSDADRLADRAQQAGTLRDYRRFPGLWHDFHLFAGLLAEADEAVTALSAEMRTALRGA